MEDAAREEIEKLETLRELALCGPEEQREQAHRAYEELRTKLLDHRQCETPEEGRKTQELRQKEQV